METLVGRLRPLLPIGCGVAVGAIAACGTTAFAEEEALVATAGPGRRQEFRAGRWLARKALDQAGGPAVGIRAHAEGDPIWPTGFVGSICHADHVAAAIAAPTRILAGVGLDLESDLSLESELRALVCRSDEGGDTALAARGIDAAKLRFIAKEAYFKAVFPLTRRLFDFLDVRVAFDPEDAFRVESGLSRCSGMIPGGREVVGRFTHADGLLAALAYVRAW